MPKSLSPDIPNASDAAPWEAPFSDSGKLRETVASNMNDAISQDVEYALTSMNSSQLSLQMPGGTLTDEGLRRWCLNGYEDSTAGKRVFGKDILLDALFSPSFWKSLSEYVSSLGKAEIVAMGGKMPKSLGSYSPRIKSAGFDTVNPKNMCLWLGALDAESSTWCDDAGWLTGEWLRRWFHAGYIDSFSGERVFWRDIFTRFQASGNFWKEVENYAASLSPETLRSIWGKFPVWVSSFAGKIKGEGEKKISIGEILEWLGGNADDFVTMKTLKGYLTDEWLQRWSREWYEDPETGDRIFGKDILLKCFYSGSFWKTFSDYANSLGPLDFEGIWWKISPTPNTYEQKLSRAGFQKFNLRDFCVWLGAVDSESAKYVDEFGMLSPLGLQRWYSEWYVDPITGIRIIGKDVLVHAKASKNFWEYLLEYSRQLDFRHYVLLWGKFPREKPSFSERIFDTESMTMSDFLAFLSGGNPDELSDIERLAKNLPPEASENFMSSVRIPENMKKTMHYLPVGSEIPRPKFSAIVNLLLAPASANNLPVWKRKWSKSQAEEQKGRRLQYAQIRIGTTIGKILQIFEDLGVSGPKPEDFDSVILTDKIEIFSRDPSITAHLRKHRKYIDDTVMLRARDGMEWEFVYRWY